MATSPSALTGMASDARRYEDLFRRFAPPFRGPAGPFSLKTVRRTVFRALEPQEGKAFGRATQRRPYGMASDARRYGLAGKLTVPCFCFLFPVVAGDREIAPTDAGSALLPRIYAAAETKEHLIRPGVYAGAPSTRKGRNALKGKASLSLRASAHTGVAIRFLFSEIHLLRTLK